ncbi:hypothetical protein HDA45_003054 [Amycolatopsis umgeniensis]|uniref:Uncharacterized protein n=1 Tax=Amycolatopsis umgeniensis TaxID=336628 RepID=A0A841B0Y4_9PSEU|nr:hypothetical protein [Amycolatopsis umgeniensis]
MRVDISNLRHLEREIACALMQTSAAASRLSADYLQQLASLMGQNMIQQGPGKRLQRARIHDNGFLKLLAVNGDEWEDDSLNGYRLVLHIWDTSIDAASVENVHNHRWPFWSTSVCGRLGWEHYTVSSESGPDPTHWRFRYASPGSADSYSMISVGPAVLARSFKAAVERGTSIAMECHELHRVQRLGSSPAATIVLQGRPIREETDVFANYDGIDEREEPLKKIAVKLQTCSPAETATLLDSIIHSTP